MAEKFKVLDYDGVIIEAITIEELISLLMPVIFDEEGLFVNSVYGLAKWARENDLSFSIGEKIFTPGEFLAEDYRREKKKKKSVAIEVFE